MTDYTKSFSRKPIIEDNNDGLELSTLMSKYVYRMVLVVYNKTLFNSSFNNCGTQF